MKNLSSILENSKKKPRLNIYNQQEELIRKYDFTIQELDIVNLAFIYQKAKIKHLGVNVFVSPFKVGDPRITSKKLWSHFTIMDNVFKEHKINPYNYFDYIFKKLKSGNCSSLAVWFVYAEQYINSYLLLNNKTKISNTKIMPNDPSVIKRICDNLVKETMARRHCTEEQFWKEIYVNNIISKFPIEYLRNNEYYKKNYANGEYKIWKDFPNPFKN